MIIKAVRVAARRVPALCSHLIRGDENDRVEILRGSEADMRDWRDDADRRQCAYAVRQFIIAPKERITREQALEVVAMLAEEFGFSQSGIVVVEHAKSRATGDAHEVHWHLCAPEVDAVSGHVLSSSHDRPRHEYLARVAEERFGHAITPGAHDTAVAARLRREGRNDLADRLETTRVEGAERPRQAYAHDDHQKAARIGIDMPALRLLVANAARDRIGHDALAAKLAANGVALKPGERSGEWIVSKQGEFVASVRRLAGLRVADFRQWTEGWNDHDRGRDSEPDEGKPRGPGDAEAPSGNPGGAWRARRFELPASDAGHARAPGLGRDGPATVSRGPAPGRSGASDSRGLKKGALGGLIAPVEEIVRRATKVRAAAGACAAGDDDYLRLCCEKFETDARAAIDAAQRRTLLSTDGLDAAKAQEDDARARVVGIRQRKEKLYEDRAQLQRQREGLHFWERGRVGKEIDARLSALTAEESKLEAAGAKAHRHVMSSIALHVHAQRAYTTARDKAARDSSEILTKQGEVLAAVNVVRQLFRFWPDVARLGPLACYRLGRDVVRKKSQLMNPNAKDIWGVPLAWDP